MTEVSTGTSLVDDLPSPMEFKKNMLKRHFAKHFQERSEELLDLDTGHWEAHGVWEDGTRMPATEVPQEVNRQLTESDTPDGVHPLVNYASKDAGAVLISASKGVKGASNLLEGNADKYALAPCDNAKNMYFVVQLSEEVRRSAFVVCGGAVPTWSGCPCPRPTLTPTSASRGQIRVEKVVLANYERYSSRIAEFALAGSQTFPVSWRVAWVVLPR